VIRVRSIRLFRIGFALVLVAGMVPILASPGSAGLSCNQQASAPRGGQSFQFFSVSAGGDDGRVWGRDRTLYPPAVTKAVTGANQVLTARSFYVDAHPPYYHIGNSLLRFNTAPLNQLKGATITGATLCIYVRSMSNDEERNLTADWYSSSKWPIDKADYSKAFKTTALAGYPLGNLTPGAYRQVPLTNADGVNTGGFTGIRLHVNGGKPTGKNYVYTGTFEGGQPAGLFVFYTTGG